MDLLYVPIMAAKRGELTALSKLSASTSSKILPLFELPGKKPDRVLVEPSIQRTAKNSGKSWAGRTAFLDISNWSPNSRTETGVHVLEYTFSQFQSQGINVHPVIGYDRWGDADYVQAIINITSAYSLTPCIRFDREAIDEDMLDPVYFAGQVSDMLETVSLTPNNCFVMIDFGDVSKLTVPDIISKAEPAIDILRSIGFSVIAIAGGSMPAGVNQAVGKCDTNGCIPRYEMIGWKAILSTAQYQGIVFSDYVVRNAGTTEGIISPHANAKIRYTIENQYFIVRGHSKKLDSLTEQHKALAQKLIASHYYMGVNFSVGDSELFHCSLGNKELRDATSMIAVDSNHHVQTVITEVFEHQNKYNMAKMTFPTPSDL